MPLLTAVATDSTHSTQRAWIRFGFSVLALAAFWPATAYAQEPIVSGALGEGGALHVPTFWYLLAAGLALLVPAGFAGVLHKALSLNAVDRPSSAAEMRQMLRESESFFRRGTPEPDVVSLLVLRRWH